jgi:AcrR family transcriptional regulator
MNTLVTKTNDQPQPTRKRGRPVRNGPDRREDIVQAATHLFLSAGYTSATLRRIAQAASVNVALVHYYFTSKQGLYEEVLNTALSPALSSLKNFQRTHLTINDIATALTAPLYKHPQLFQILSLTEGPPEALDAAKAAKRRIHINLVACMKTMQRLGGVRPDLDPDIFATTCMDLCWAPFRSNVGVCLQDESAARTASGHVSLRRHVDQNILVLMAAATSRHRTQ